MSGLEILFQSIRQAATAPTWSAGVELARAGTVVVEKASGADFVLRVATPGRPVSLTVKLWPEDEDWHCDCRKPGRACEHVAAAVIALRRAEEKGEALPSFARAVVAYAFLRRDGGLALERRLIAGATVTPLRTPLSAILAGRAAGPDLAATKEDVTIDSILGDGFLRIVGALPESSLVGTLIRLEKSPNVTLDGVPVAVGKPATAERAIVEDAGDGVRVFFERAPGVDELFANGAALGAGTLCPRTLPNLSPIEKEIATRGRTFTRGELPDVASRIVPELERKMAVDVRTSRLPKLGLEDRPRLVLQTTATGEVLGILPLIVYGDPPYARVDGGRLVLLGDANLLPDRDLGAENRLVAALHRQLGLSVGKRVEYRGDAALKMTERLAAERLPVIGEGLDAFSRQSTLVPSITVEGDELRVAFQVPGGGSAADPARVFQAWREGLERVPLLEGGWAPLPKDWLRRYGAEILNLLESREREGKLPVHAWPDLARLCEALDVPCAPDLSRLSRALETFEGIPSATLPSDLTAELRSYQRQGVDWLAFLRSSGLGALLADDMGLGKTLQTICVLRKPSLVVAPTSVLSNWEKELARFRPELKVAIFHGAGRAVDEDADVTLTTYAILRRDSGLLSSITWDTAVLDEAQNIKNPESQVAAAAYSLEASFRIALTGTPVENRLEDLWSLFHFLNRGLLGGRSSFQERYGAAATDASCAAALRTRTKPFLLRRLKRDVAAELPERTELVLYCELEPEERDRYDAVLAASRRDAIAALDHGGGMLAALECLLRLRQAACHPGLLPGGTAADSSKFRLLREQLAEVVAEGHKALVFSQWTSLLDLLGPGLDEAGLAYARIDGGTPAAERARIVEGFQTTAGPPLLLMTLKAGGVGLNLTAADHVFLLDPWWNPAAEDQAADRAHRIGQTRPVFVHRLIARETVEERIMALQGSKRAAAAAALEGTAAGGAGLTREDLLGLLA